MNIDKCGGQLSEFIAQGESDGRNFPIKAESNWILGDDDPAAHMPHNGPGYLLHCGWAARKLMQSTIPPAQVCHYDFGSYLYFASVASAIVPRFVYCDVRPYEFKGLKGLEGRSEDLTTLSMPDNSVQSASCLHVLEHVGLGRYGDKVDSMGDVKGAWELTRVLAPGGRLIFVVPVNRQPGVVWNAHRQYGFLDVIRMFPSLRLLEFSLIVKDRLLKNADPEEIVSHPGNVEDTGCFWFEKPEEEK